MSQSQQSEFASSQFGGDYENLPYLIPSNYPATPSTSQQTFDVSVPAFLRPDDPPLLPQLERFERVGPDRKRSYFLYDRMNHQEWVEWWLQTDYGSKGKVAWHSNHLSHVWEHFTQVAHSSNGSPKVMFRRRLSARVKERQDSILKLLPADAKISIALDCWTSPFGQAFMAITGYFVDIDWSYREVLLGFKPLEGTHTGANLSGVLLEILTDHNIQDRVFGLTTDNASNNKTLVDSLQQALSSNVHIIRIPCLAHVIQLSLNQLLDRLKAVPQNDITETRWSDRQSILAKANAQSKNRSISHTLNKVRYLAVYIRASPQRREAFVSLQPSEQALMPLQDVKARWNSTFLMLRRAKRLRDFLGTFCTDYNCEEMALNNDEWRQIDYLLCLTKPFYEYTLALSKTRDVTAHLVFQIYNILFEHLEKSIKQLQRKRVPWKQQMLSSLEAGRLKLDEYYSQTDHDRDHLYAISTMLAPDNRFQFFLSDDWTKEWQRHTTSQGLPVSSPGSRPSTALHNLLRRKKPKAKPVGDEITQYLDGDIVDSEPLPFWRENQSRFPAIALLVRDILAIPATGAGVERLFNTARDICHYRRGRMKAETIEELMLFLCTSRFDLELHKAKELERFFSLNEIEALSEEKDDRLDDVEIEQISDTEEQPESLGGLIDVDDDNTGDDDAGDPPLPSYTTQPRMSGRKRKHIEDDMYQSH
ncbi:hypothetical protein PENVUL_c105G07924 [Penicillium vulpinum]|uniref:HAT C-terminal dimerisation domain-containing protein n=1 Tax=Penicillium vulpinum TaxID=29845 RepID=A0A1V6R2T9_9EURO|nr:hypothetical protein PENVUL_c105G07924 [Penicillium vulpinum]